MKPSATWFRPPKLEGWTAILPFLVFLGGLAMAAGLNDLSDLAASRAYARGFIAPLLAPPREPPAKTVRGRAVVSDFEPLSALLLPAGELAVHHEEVFVATVRVLNGQIPVVAIVKDTAQEEHCLALMRVHGIENRSLHFLHHSLDSMWLRDFGPVFVHGGDGGIAIVDTSYSGGATVERWRDDEFPIVLAKALGLPFESAPLRLQGGNLLSNGADLLLTSTSVSHENRSRGFGSADLAGEFAVHFGSPRWLRVEPLDGDPTNHVDMFVTMVSPDQAVVAQASSGKDAACNAHLESAAAALAELDTAAGSVQVHRIPLPPATSEGFIRSYNNIVIANEIVLVPSFSRVDPDLERRVHALYQRLLPGKRIVPIPCDSLLGEGGLLRCVTLGIPRGVSWQRLYRRSGQ